MSRAIVAWAVGVFALTVLVQVPAAFVARQLGWPVGWQPEGVSGSLWDGRAARIGALGPVQWRLRPWAQDVQLNLGFQQRTWRLSIHGWPWRWQAQLAPRSTGTHTATLFVLDGEWEGHLQINGAGRSCRSTQGTLLGHDLALLSPWTVNLGNTRIQLQCTKGLRLLAQLQLDAEHSLKLDVDPQGQRARLDGHVEPGAALTPLLVQARWLQPTAQTFSKVFGKP